MNFVLTALALRLIYAQDLHNNKDHGLKHNVPRAICVCLTSRNAVSRTHSAIAYLVPT